MDAEDEATRMSSLSPFEKSTLAHPFVIQQITQASYWKLKKNEKLRLYFDALYTEWITMSNKVIFG